ncbi:hypothetical protein [Blastopirellula marina]|uniref:hypothetical protein n=1 Tax=Blastopirellula marina TaxID=124 RepID=UPI0002D45AA0|nr:hypothetical protein [Blastopirellula marina]
MAEQHSGVSLRDLIGLAAAIPCFAAEVPTALASITRLARKIVGFRIFGSFTIGRKTAALLRPVVKELFAEPLR